MVQSSTHSLTPLANNPTLYKVIQIVVDIVADCCIIESSDKEIVMTGSIRAFVGFMIVFGAVGGLENTMDSQVGQLLALCSLAAAGLGLMYSGVAAMNK